MKPLLVLRSWFLLVVVVGVSLLVVLSLVGDSASVVTSSLWPVELHPASRAPTAARRRRRLSGITIP